VEPQRLAQPASDGQPRGGPSGGPRRAHVAPPRSPPPQGTTRYFPTAARSRPCPTGNTPGSAIGSRPPMAASPAKARTAEASGLS